MGDELRNPRAPDQRLTCREQITDLSSASNFDSNAINIHGQKQAVKFFNGMGSPHDLYGVFSEASFRGLQRIWHGYTKNRIGLPRVEHTEPPDNIHPTLAKAYRALATLRGMWQMKGYVPNKDFAVNVLLYTLHQAYFQARDYYLRNAGAMDPLGVIVPPGSSQRSGSALIKLYFGG